MSTESNEADRRDCIAANVRVTVEDNEPAIELPDGSVLQLRTTVKEWTHEEPMRGEVVDTDTEADVDDYPWWTVYPSRSNVSAADQERNFPEIVIEPHGFAPGGGGGD